MNEELLLKISNKYVLKDIFRNLKYNHVLKLIKYNKKLQQILNVDIKSYNLDYNYYKKEINNNTFSLKKFHKNDLTPFLKKLSYLMMIINLVIFILNLINLGFWKKNAVNILLIFSSLIIFITFVYYLTMTFVFENFNINFLKCNPVIYIIILILFISKCISDKNNKLTLNMYIDLIECILDFLFIIIHIIYSYQYINKVRSYDLISIAVLTQYKGFKINDFICSKEFLSLDTLNRNYYLLQNENYFNYKINGDQQKLIALINNFRIKNGLRKLNYNKNESLDEYFITEVQDRFYCFENIINLSNNKYLLIYPIEEIKKNFLMNKDIIEILLKDILDKILVLNKGNYEYILIYKFSPIYNDSDNDNANTYRKIHFNEDRIQTSKRIIFQNK